MVSRTVKGHCRSGGIGLRVSPWRVLGGVLSGALLIGSAIAAPVAEREVIGQSPNGEPISVWTLADRSSGDAPDDRPAILIVAGLQGHHQIGTVVAESIGKRLIEEHADALAGRTVYIIPRVNPEGLARFSSGQGWKALSGRAPEMRDADRDRRTDEDPPNDLNGDGFITLMRVPAPVSAFDLDATHVIDADDARLVREPGDDERATHAVLIEGVDDDGDGRFNEDGWGGSSGGGVDLDMHFPTHWPEHTDGAGLYPLARPEATAIVDWMLEHDNIAAVIVLGPHDTIVSTPSAGRYGAAGQVPTGIESGDSAAYELAAEVFKDITGIAKAEAGPDRAGSFIQWAYADFGVYAFATPVWVRPDLVVPAESGSDEDSDASVEVADLDASTEPTAEDVAEADRADLVERGVGQRFVEILYMDADDRAAVLSEMESMDQAEMQQLIQEYTALPADVQARLTAVRNGGEDPGPSAELIETWFGAGIVSAGGSNSGGGGSGGGGVGNSPDAKWLAWIDENAPGGFVDWEPFDHPQLGEVEIGGFVPGVRVNPPAGEEKKLTEQQAAFAAAVLEMLPSLAIDQPTVERVGGGVWRVGITLRNDGVFPTKSAIGIKSRRLPGVVCVLDPEQRLENGQIVSGTRAIRFVSIEGRGASERAEWLVVAEVGDQVTLEIRTPLTGTTRYELTMENN